MENNLRHSDKNPNQTPEQIKGIDAKNLINESNEHNIPVDQLIRRKTDNKKELTKAIQERIARLAGFTIVGKVEKEEVNATSVDQGTQEVVVDDKENSAQSEFSIYIKNLNLSDVDKDKLIEMMSEANWQEALATVRELDPDCEIPADLYQRTLEQLIKYNPERLNEICAEDERPVIQIETDNEFEEGKVNNMNKNKHYRAINGKNQEDAFVVQGEDKPYRKVKKGRRVVTIVDGTPRPKDQVGAPHHLEARREYEIKRLEKKNMELIDAHGQTTLMQRTLREAEQKGDNSVIIDNWEDGNGTVTILNPKNLADSKFVAYSFFDSRDRRADFLSSYPDIGYDFIRGRASVQVLKF